MLSARHRDLPTENIEYANSLLPESGEYLPLFMLSAFVRADISEEEAVVYIQRNKEFLQRLTYLLPALVCYFDPQTRPRNLLGLLGCLEDCHNDYYATAQSPRRDRRIRETRESLNEAITNSASAIVALEAAQRFIDLEFSRYHGIYYQASTANGAVRRDVAELIHELKMCSGVAEIVRAAMDFDLDYLFLSGNDKRSTVVEYAYQMSTMWNGPKLVTTPGSDFSILCSLLFEAVSGISDESLAGAINRYARSDDRRKHDIEEAEFREEEASDDNFSREKRAMKVSAREIERSTSLLKTPGLSMMARTLLLMRIDREQREYDEAQGAKGPNQVLMSHLNAEQLENLFRPVVDRVSGKSLNNLDMALGKVRRASKPIDQ
jgi:hypothetical protein